MRIKEWNYQIRNAYEKIHFLVAKEPRSNILKTPTQCFVEIYFN